jgi:hypothetical protein
MESALRAQGYRHVKPRTVKRDSEYRGNSIANHTHYWKRVTERGFIAKLPSDR